METASPVARPLAGHGRAEAFGTIMSAMSASCAVLLAFFLLIPMMVTAAPGAPSPRYLADRRLFVLDGGPVTYIVGVNERDELQHVYWGGRLWRDEDLRAAQSVPQFDGVDPSTTNTPEEFPGWGGARFFEPCVKVALADGVRDLVLKYGSHEIKGGDLLIHMKDIGYDLDVTLSYRMDPSGILRKQATIRNRTAQVVTVESAQSGVWYLPAGDGYRLASACVMCWAAWASFSRACWIIGTIRRRTAGSAKER